MNETTGNTENGYALEMLNVAPLGVCCYLVGAREGRERVVIDPGGDAGAIRDFLDARGLRPALILLTHAHYDHIGGCDELRDGYPGLEAACHPVCARMCAGARENFSFHVVGRALAVRRPEREIEDGGHFFAAGIEWEARLVPGHAEGHLVYYAARHGLLFSGDTVFRGSIGRSDFPGGDAGKLISALTALLSSLPPETKIYPGHMEDTTVGRELKHNPFLRPDGKLYRYNV